VPIIATCAGPSCGVSLEGRPATARYCGERCRKAAFRARARPSRPVPKRRAGASQPAAGNGATSETTTTTAAERRVLASLGRAGHDPRSPEQYASALERETMVSLKQDPERWAWKRSSEVPDRRHLKGRRAAP
jgi:hypothetical protein